MEATIITFGSGNQSHFNKYSGANHARKRVVGLAGAALVRGSEQPIYRQLHRLLQQAILSRELPAGTRVPSSRLLAAELGIARNTVTQVYEQLALEGYVHSATGRGAVADSAPDEIVGAPLEPGASPAVAASPARRLSARGTRLVEGAGVSKRQGGAFMPGVPRRRAFRRASGPGCTTSTGGACVPIC
jgi:DNA-binding transcriptional regulator YhcF (GntR family)